MIDNSINDHKSKTVISVSGRNEKCKGNDCFASNSAILNYDYADNLKKISIFFDKSKYIVNKDTLGEKIHNVRKIFSECIDDNVNEMSVKVLDKNNLKQYSHMFDKPNSIHVNFDSGNQVLIYSWPPYHQFDGNKWQNFLSQLEKDYNLGFIGTGPLQFKYEGLNYLVYPPFFSLSHEEAFHSYKSEVFSFSPTEVNQIIENIKRSHQSIEKKIIDHYQSIGKDFVESDEDFVAINTDVNNKTTLSSIVYFNKPNGVYEVKLELYKTIPLHAWAKLGDSVSQRLENELDKGADINAKDKDGKTPFDLTTNTKSHY